MTSHPFRLSSMLLAVLALAPETRSQAQQRSWTGTARASAEVGYDDNPFLLKRGRKAQLEQGSAADAMSGRFTDMASATDFVPRPTLELGLEGSGLGGRSLDLVAELAYEANLENARRRHAELGFTVAQALRHDGRLRLDVEWRPAYFHKNYLRDAADVSGDGNITPEERRYEAGVSHAVEVWGGYRRRLVKGARERPLELHAELEVGYVRESYDAPFAGRGRRGPGVGLDLALDVSRRWTLGLDYTYRSLASDVAPAVLILDETAFGTDFNGNGNASDIAARGLVNVDASRAEHAVALTVTGQLSRGTDLNVAYEYRRRTFGSEQPYDVVHRSRVDGRHDVAADLDVRVTSGFHLVIGARHRGQTTNRAGDPGSTGEETDYTRNVLSAGLRYRF